MNNRKEVTREIDPDLLDVEDRAKWLEDTFVLRGRIDQIRGHAAALHGMRLRNNELFEMAKPRIKSELLKLREAVDVALKKVS